MARYIDARKLREKLREQAAIEWNRKAAPRSWSSAFEYVIGIYRTTALNCVPTAA